MYTYGEGAGGVRRRWSEGGIGMHREGENGRRVGRVGEGSQMGWGRREERGCVRTEGDA